MVQNKMFKVHMHRILGKFQQKRTIPAPKIGPFVHEDQNPLDLFVVTM